MLNIEQAVQDKFPKFQHSKPWFKKSTLSFLRHITHEQEVNRFLEQHSQLAGFDFIDEVLDYFNFSYNISNRHRHNIPATGRVVIVANHPLGALDGLSLLKMVGEVRRDVKIVANDMLLNFAALSPLFLPVDNLSKSTRKSSVGNIIAGEVSRIRPSGVRDGKWNSGFLNFAKKTNAPVLPVFVGARNSSLFYSASMVYKPLSGMMLAHEMFNKNSKTIQICVGEPIPYQQIEALPLVKAEKAKLLRRHLYRLAKGKKPLFKTENTIAHPQDRRAIKQELKSAQLLGETADQKKIYLFDYRPDSAVMQEIGRLREMTFRQVGEGTGKKRDLDQYDRDYKHLILWDEQELEIAGAYRIGAVANIQQQNRQIYSAELFDYQPAMQPYFAKGIELGRSFVSPKYWGKRSLDYLWYGIGAYLKQFPEVRYLFGPVSLSASYPAFGQALIVQYYQRYFADHEQLAVARSPYQTDAESLSRINALFTGEAENDFTLMREQQAHMQVTVPTLYKQYADVCETGGVRFIDFNIDANFGFCIDGLVMVDLQELKPAKRKRYLGE